MAERSAGVSELARAIPPNLPNATALGFFLLAMARIISLSGMLVKEELLISALLPPLHQFGTTPLETDIAAQANTR